MSFAQKLCAWVIANAPAGLRRRLQLEANRRAFERLGSELGDPEALGALCASGRLRRAIRPVPAEAPRGERVLVLAAHQDDETIGSGGTLIRCARLGKTVKVIYLTGGEPGNKATSQDAAVREKEARAVWKQIGGEEPEFWGLPCRELPASEALAVRLRAAISEFDADCIFVPHFLEPPQDHRCVAELLAMAHRAEPLPESTEIWCYQVSAMLAPNVVVETSDLAEDKDAVSRLWKSQNRNFDYLHFSRGMSAYNSIHLGNAGRGQARARFAEVFVTTTPDEYSEWLLAVPRPEPGEGAEA